MKSPEAAALLPRRKAAGKGQTRSAKRMKTRPFQSGRLDRTGAVAPTDRQNDNPILLAWSIRPERVAASSSEP